MGLGSQYYRDIWSSRDSGSVNSSYCKDTPRSEISQAFAPRDNPLWFSDITMHWQISIAIDTAEQQVLG